MEKTHFLWLYHISDGNPYFSYNHVHISIYIIVINNKLLEMYFGECNTFSEKNSTYVD